MSEIITDERVCIKTAELLLTHNTLGSDEGLSDEMRNRICELLVRTAGKRYELSLKERAELLSALEERFTKNPEHYSRPKGVNFADVKKAVEANHELMYSLAKMEQTHGAPDIIEVTEDAFIFGDCAAKSPWRHDLFYSKAVEMAEDFGVQIMDEETYRAIQKTGKFDLDSKSFIKTPKKLLETDTALLGHRSGDEVVVDNVYASSGTGGWRGVLRVPRV